MWFGRQVTWGLAQSQSGQPISMALINPTHSLILFSVRSLCHLGLQELPGTFQDQKKSPMSSGFAFGAQRKVGKQPRRTEQENKVGTPQGELNIQIFFIFALLRMQEGQGRGEPASVNCLVVPQYPPSPKSGIICLKGLNFFPLLMNNYCF